MPLATIESLDHEGRGVAHVDGKAIFIEGALPGELVEYESHRRKPSYELASALRVIEPSSARVAPRCPHFGVCGGCSMQHVDAGVQAAVKQRVLEDALWHIGRIRPEVMYPAILGPAWGYRFRARLSVRLVPKKGGVLVGFHERRSSYVADMTSCQVLPPRISRLLPEMRRLIGGLSIADRLPQVEVAIGDEDAVLVLRVLEPLAEGEIDRLDAFATEAGVRLFLQTGGPETAAPLRGGDRGHLEYRLPEFHVTIRFKPTDFTQVNHAMNAVLVRRAVALLDPQPGERIADLFCGLGNFSLPIARRGAKVLGIEGNPGLVRRAAENAALNGLDAQAHFVDADLFEIDAQRMAQLGPFDKLMVDPPREGAIAVVKALGDDAPQRIVYVSCNPATLARDAAVLTHEKGYRLCGAGIANMFPHTSHVESIALFEK